MEEFVFQMFDKPRRDYEKAVKNIRKKGVTQNNWAFADLYRSGTFSFHKYGGGSGGNDPLIDRNLHIPDVVTYPAGTAPAPIPVGQQQVVTQVIPEVITTLSMPSINNTNNNNSPTTIALTADEFAHTVTVADAHGQQKGYQQGTKDATAVAQQKLKDATGIVNYELTYGGSTDIEKGQLAIIKAFRDKFVGQDMMLEFPDYKNRPMEIVTVEAFLQKKPPNQKSFLSRLKEGGEIRIMKKTTDYDTGTVYNDWVGTIKKV